MIRKFIITSITLLFLNSPILADVVDCNKFSKLSKDYLKCQKDNLKQKSDDSGLTGTVENFKSSNTLSEFFKKNKK